VVVIGLCIEAVSAVWGTQVTVLVGDRRGHLLGGGWPCQGRGAPRRHDRGEDAACGTV
jgi:hypothetical protein